MASAAMTRIVSLFARGTAGLTVAVAMVFCLVSGLSQSASAQGPAPTCSPGIADLWSPGWVVIDEIPYRLGRAYTLDTDNNGAVDDVSFEMIRQDGSKLGMSYAALQGGGPGGAPIVGLTLPDPASLGKLCPGSYTFPDPGPYVAQASPLQRPNLAAEVAARIRAARSP